MRGSRWARGGLVGALLVAWCIPPATVSAAEKTEPAHIEVNGLGWLRNREQRRSLERLLGEERGATLDADGVEDAVFLLISALVERGHLKPKVEAVAETPAGETHRFQFDERLETSLPRPFEAKSVHFNVQEGERYRFDEVTITGLTVLPVETAREYFVGEKVLISTGAARVYSPARLDRARAALAGELERRGYANATVEVREFEVDDATGDVDLEMEVNEGLRWMVRSLEVQGDAVRERMPAMGGFVGQPWSTFWQQDVVAALRNHYFSLGHPDISVRISRTLAPPEEGVQPVAIVATVAPGEEVRIGEVRFEGADQTRESVLERRVRSGSGDLLNPLAIEQARFRLSRLGVFESVDIRYEPGDGPVRDPVFELQEGRELEVNLLFGYGSYEQLRGGVEMRQFNLFGRAHQTRLLLVQSLKSSRGEYSYTVPEIFGESIDGTARVFGLQRQEVSFLRQEWGGSVSLAANVQRIGANASVGYTYQALRNRDNNLATRGADDQQVTAASVEVGLTRDRRDNPLRPRRGYRVFAQAETASRYLGGGVDYQRIEFGGSYHTAWGRGRWVHAGLNHGLITTFGTSGDSDLPVNKRFFPGGDNSIRGYQAGEAAPRNADGRFIGAKTYLLMNLELEQALTTKWSVVLFADAMGTAVRLGDYPFDEHLYSVGLGVRYQTLIGPLRAEYGKNLNPRAGDPSGTLLFSIGFPF